MGQAQLREPIHSIRCNHSAQWPVHESISATSLYGLSSRCSDYNWAGFMAEHIFVTSSESSRQIDKMKMWTFAELTALMDM